MIGHNIRGVCKFGFQCQQRRDWTADLESYLDRIRMMCIEDMHKKDKFYCHKRFPYATTQRVGKDCPTSQGFSTVKAQQQPRYSHTLLSNTIPPHTQTLEHSGALLQSDVRTTTTWTVTTRLPLPSGSAVYANSAPALVQCARSRGYTSLVAQTVTAQTAQWVASTQSMEQPAATGPLLAPTLDKE